MIIAFRGVDGGNRVRGRMRSGGDIQVLWTGGVWVSEGGESMAGGGPVISLVSGWS